MTTLGRSLSRLSVSPPVSPRDASPQTTGLSPAAARALITLDVIVAGLCPFWQGIVARSKGFDGAFMTVLETSSYIVGGAAIAGYMQGFAGVARCLSPWRYLTFLPASVAFSLSNVCTYAAVRGLGASQFTLMVQLRIVVLALFARFWQKASQSAQEWAALLQLALGVLALVAVRRELEPAHSGNDADVDEGFHHAILGLVGVIFCSSIAMVYMEAVLKANAQEPIYIQQHQLNMFGFLAALLIYTEQAVGKDVLTEVVAQGNGSASPLDLDAANSEEGLQPKLVVLTVLLVTRGILCSLVIKNMDVITKGLVDVSSIILCALLQIVFQGDPFVPSIAALQLIMCLSILMYFAARRQTAISQAEADRPALE